MNTQVVMRDIDKRFGSTLALQGVDLDLNPGEVHAILGENGAGKSTLMHILSGSMRADRGEIRLNGRPVRVVSPYTARSLGIAIVHQHFMLVPAFSVAENLALDSAPAGLAASIHYSPRRESAHALERARSLGWQLDPNARVADLSVGTQQRVEIVKALATGSRILIFDEPTAVLTGSEVDELFAVLRRLRTDGCTVVLIAHKLAEILAVADRVTVLRHGQNIATAPRDNVDAERLAAWMMGAGTAGRKSSPEKTVSPPSPAERSIAQPSLSIETSEPVPTNPSEEAADAVREGRHIALPGEDSSPALTAINISVRGDRGDPSVRDLSLEVRSGEIFGIGGVDGNGQTEIAEALVGLRPLLSGAVKWMDGEFRPGVNPITGYIPQDRRRSGLALTMSVAENLLFDAVREPAYRKGLFLRARSLRSTAQDLIQRFDIRAPGLDAPVSTLSGGNQQKIVVARALRSRPAWIVAVNPTRGLDMGAARFVREQLRQARAQGAAILLISADLDELAALSDRAAILSAGRLTGLRLQGAQVGDIGLLFGGIAPAGCPEPEPLEAEQ